MGNLSAVFEKTINQVISSVQDTFVPSSGKISSSYDVDNMDLNLTDSNGKVSNIYDSNISEFTSSKESYVNFQNLAKTELGNIDTIINNANQENDLVHRYNGYSYQSKGGYGPSMQAAQGELKRVKPELDNYIKANSSYSSYSELIDTQAELEKIDQTCGELIAYYERQIKWQEYYKIYDSEECQKSSIEGMLGEKEYHDNMSGKTFRSEEYTKLLEIRTIGNYDDKLKELFGEEYEAQFASYGLDFQFDYLKMYNYLYQTQGEEAAKEFYAFAEDNINSMDGLYHALYSINYLTSNAEIMEAITNYLTVNAEGMGDGVVGSLEGVVAWFSSNPTRSASSYKTMWYSMMLESGKYGKGQVFNYQVGQGTGQMLPVMLIGCVCPESLIVADLASVTGGTAGAILLSNSTIASLSLSQLATSGYLLMSSGGRDYKEQLINGKPRDEAIIHGLLSGTTEVTTERLLGGLPFLSETKVYNLQTLAIAMGREGTQEVCQDMISEFLLGDGIPNFNSEEERDAYWNQWLKGKMMTFAVAACSAGELQGGSIVMAQTNINYINNQIQLGKITEQEVVDLIKTQYPTETMNLSNQQIIGEYNAQIAKYIELKLSALLDISTESNSTSLEEIKETVNDTIEEETMYEQELMVMFDREREGDSIEYEMFLEDLNTIDHDIDVDNMKRLLIDWAKEEAERLENISKNQRRKFNTAAIAFDTRTGKSYFGKNGFAEESANDLLKQLLPSTTINGLKLGRCAEMEAVTKALNADKQARLEDIKLLVIVAKEEGFGDLKPLCENCDFTLDNDWSSGPKVQKVYSGSSKNWEWGYVIFRPTKGNNSGPKKMTPKNR